MSDVHLLVMLYGVVILLVGLAILTGLTWRIGPLKLTTHRAIGWWGVVGGVVILIAAIAAI